MLNDKKRFSNKVFLPAITKNLSQEILAQNLVTFKRMGCVKDEKF